MVPSTVKACPVGFDPIVTETAPFAIPAQVSVMKIPTEIIGSVKPRLFIAISPIIQLLIINLFEFLFIFCCYWSTADVIRVSANLLPATCAVLRRGQR